MKQPSPLRSQPKSFLQTFPYLLVFTTLAWAVWMFIRQGWEALAYPYPLDYGEGAVLDQAIRLASGQPIYRTDLSALSYVVNVYPPLYLSAQAPFLILWGPAFWYGRAVSLVCALAVALLLALTLRVLARDWVVSIAGGLGFLSIPYALHWARLFRVDMLALFLSWAALFVIVRWPKERWSFFAALTLLVASIYTRQSYLLAAPLAAACWIFHQSGWKHAFSFLAWLAGLLAGIFVVLNLATGGGFFFNTVTILGRQSVSVDTIRYYVDEVSTHMPWFLAASALFMVVALSKRGENLSGALVLPYLAGSLVSALTIGKPGSNVNYLLELSVALCFSTAMVLAWLQRWPWMRALALVLLGLQIYMLGQWLQGDYYRAHYAEPRPENAEIAELIRKTDGPVLTDEYIGLLLLERRPVYIQPFDFTALAQNGLWDQGPFLEMLDRREFELIIIYNPYNALVRQRWTKEMLQHIRSNYEQIEPIGENEIYRRRP